MESKTSEDLENEWWYKILLKIRWNLKGKIGVKMSSFLTFAKRFRKLLFEF